MAAIAVVARRQDLPRLQERPLGAEALRLVGSALPALFTPVGGIRRALAEICRKR